MTRACDRNGSGLSLGQDPLGSVHGGTVASLAVELGVPLAVEATVDDSSTASGAS